MSKHTTDKPEWKPGDPCPFCEKVSVKFNGGQPRCIADDCGKFMPGPPRVVKSARMTGTGPDPMAGRHGAFYMDDGSETGTEGTQ